MSLPSWPSSVPYNAAAGWQMPQMFVAPLATDMEGGNQRLRTRPGSNVAVINYPLIPLSFAEWGDLDAFLRTTLNNGASRFTMTLLTGAAYETKTVQLEQGKSPQVTNDAVFVNVVLPLRVYLSNPS